MRTGTIVIAVMLAAAPHYIAAAEGKANASVEAETEITVAASMLPIAVSNDSNKYWLDYQTDVSEAKRELASDLDRATDEEDVREAWAEYYRELHDAQKDYSKEMAERGYRVADFKTDADIMVALLR
ncbi:hypothetical protein A6F68_01004 [Tsuneonella dongtanensis]|uniref:Uncharacterized protein n=1 Tax=Tsuneonella dongtanensis TaxID=692370 RepID=A0A1B2ABR6_9SPHN|nr:hypothetical protein A6F68_01004 [Tsuneonella dongtanensis]